MSCLSSFSLKENMVQSPRNRKASPKTALNIIQQQQQQQQKILKNFSFNRNRFFSNIRGKSIYHVHNYQTYKSCIKLVKKKYPHLYELYFYIEVLYHRMIHDFVVFSRTKCSHTRNIIEMNKYFLQKKWSSKKKACSMGIGYINFLT